MNSDSKEMSRPANNCARANEQRQAFWKCITAPECGNSTSSGEIHCDNTSSPASGQRDHIVANTPTPELEPEPLQVDYQQMCFILLSTCSACTSTIHRRYTLCTHASTHSFDPTTCPNRMKARRSSAEKECEKCEHRRGSLSEMPSTEWGAEEGEQEEGDTEELEKERKAEEDMYAEVLRMMGLSKARRMRRANERKRGRAGSRRGGK
ncbi:hypothetical protein DE146DRAFT_775612 [Phaeosphaeria sp. MPI-PUGE-AT-0046c]|nr:hypothetical protein DE146DRAFT_775612 [Phaeosphaeria sp. MPI-PUGE-AT-0046c]